MKASPGNAMDKHLDYRGDVKALLGRGGELVFVTAHPEGQPAAVYRVDLDKAELKADALPAGGAALVVADEVLYVAGTDGHVHRGPVGGGALAPFGARLDPAPCALALLADGLLAALAGDTVVVLRRADGAEVQRLALPEPGTALAADASGAWLVAGTSKGTVAVFDREDKDAFLAGESAKLHEGAVTALLFEPGGLRFLSAGVDARLFSTHARGALEPADRCGPEGAVTALVDDGERFYTTGHDGHLESWGRSAGQRRPQTEKGAGRGIALARVELRGRPHLALAVEDNTIRLFQLDDAGTVSHEALTLLRRRRAPGELTAADDRARDARGGLTSPDRDEPGGHRPLDPATRSAPTSPSRRRFLQASAAATVTMAALLGGASSAHARRAPPPDRPVGWIPGRSALRGRRPNFLILMVDEMRYPPVYESEQLAAFRQQHLLTQNALRATGVELHRHYAASVACAPSRASFYTGQYPSLHGVSQTDGAAKGPAEPDMFWLDQNGVPTMGEYFRAAGYRTFWKGKWHVSHADLLQPGTQSPYVGYDDHGNRDRSREAVYLAADRLDAYGFEGWIGPEPHGSNPYNSGSSTKVRHALDGTPLGPTGRDESYASMAVEQIQALDRDRLDQRPWLLVSSFVNPHDIALWGLVANLGAAAGLLDFEFAIDDNVVPFDLWNDALFQQSLNDDLATKPTCQLEARDSYRQWMQPILDRVKYQRFYYQLHRNVDEQMLKVYEALKASRFYRDTIIIFTSDHGDFLGSHGDMHQKWYTAYEEAIRVPFILSNPELFGTPRSIDETLTSHVDIVPTMLGLAGIDAESIRSELEGTHREAQPLVGRDLSGLVLGTVAPATVDDPVFFMTDDDMSRGLDQTNFIGIPFASVGQPNHIETVIATLEASGQRKVWKFSRYFDPPQFWSEPPPRNDPPRDIVVQPLAPPIRNDPDQIIPYRRTVKTEPVPEQYEMYCVSDDPMELRNLAGDPAHAATQVALWALLDEQVAQKRLEPLTPPGPGSVPVPPIPSDP